MSVSAPAADLPVVLSPADAVDGVNDLVVIHDPNGGYVPICHLPRLPRLFTALFPAEKDRSSPLVRFTVPTSLGL